MFYILKAKKTSFKEAKDSELLTVQFEANRGKTSNEKELSKVFDIIFCFILFNFV